MTNLLQKAFDVASHLPVSEQDAIAAIVLEEIASEAKWDESFKNSQEWLEMAAKKALTDFKMGNTQLLDPDNL